MTSHFSRTQQYSRRKSIVTLSKVKQLVLAGLAFLCLPVLLSPVMSATASLRVPAEDGGALFGQKCALCHGKDGKGLPQWRAKGQPDFTDAHFQSSVTDQQISDVIHNGKGKFMPPFKEKLSDEQITALVAQVRAFGKK
jgi:cytochrome c6